MKTTTSFLIFISILFIFGCTDENNEKDIHYYVGIHDMNCHKYSNYSQLGTTVTTDTTYQTDLEISVQNDSIWITENTSNTNTPILMETTPEIENEINYTQFNGVNYYYTFRIDLITDSIFIVKYIQFNSGGSTYTYKGMKE